MSIFHKCLATCLFLLGVAGCGWLPEVKDESADWSAEKLYSEAHGALRRHADYRR